MEKDMSAGRFIEYSVVIVLTFVVVALLSFASSRQSLRETRTQVEKQWTEFVQKNHLRSQALPGLVEALRRSASGQSKLAETLLEARLIAARPENRERYLRAVDDIETALVQIRGLTESNPALLEHLPFRRRWIRIDSLTQTISENRRLYNNYVEMYNRLLAVFPQNLVAGILGYLPLDRHVPGRRLYATQGSLP
jgi:LemA protein